MFECAFKHSVVYELFNWEEARQWLLLYKQHLVSLAICANVSWWKFWWALKQNFTWCLFEHWCFCCLPYSTKPIFHEFFVKASLIMIYFGSSSCSREQHKRSLDDRDFFFFFSLFLCFMTCLFSFQEKWRRSWLVITGLACFFWMQNLSFRGDVV